MLAEGRFVKDLEAVVGQMDIQVLIVDVVFLGGGTQIAFVEEVDVELVWVVLNVDKRPHANVKLTLFVEKRPFDVLLNDPLGVWRLFIDVGDDISNFGEKLDSSALVKGCGLKNPLVVLTVFLWNRFVKREAFSNMKIRKAFFEPIHF